MSTRRCAAAVLTTLYTATGCASGETIRWTNGGIELNGKLTLPVAEGPNTLVVFVAGSGNSHAGLDVVRAHVEYLTALGLAVFSYDKRGTGDSGGDWREVGLVELAEDVAAVLPGWHPTRGSILSASYSWV